MHALPVSLTPYDAVRVVPFDPFADPARMAIKRNTILAQLSAERSKPRPNALLIKAYEIWLRGYHKNMAR
jgi:hypothetical protein